MLWSRSARYRRDRGSAHLGARTGFGESQDHGTIAWLAIRSPDSQRSAREKQARRPRRLALGCVESRDSASGSWSSDAGSAMSALLLAGAAAPRVSESSPFGEMKVKWASDPACCSTVC